MFGFKKKDKEPLHVKLKEDQFCYVIEKKASDVTNKFCFIAQEVNYNLLYRDGSFYGMPHAGGGRIFPFSTDPTRPGSKGEMKQFSEAQIVCLSKDFNLMVRWGGRTALKIYDKEANRVVQLGARGTFYICIDPTDAARKADMFYRKLLTQRNAELFNTEALRDFLASAFENQFAAKLEQYLESVDMSVTQLVGLKPSQYLDVSAALYPTIKDLLAVYGISIVETSKSSLLEEARFFVVNDGGDLTPEN